MTPFEKRITAEAADIDELGHVNNAAWVRWIQDIATAHWEAVAPEAHRTAYVWVVTRHEIDYLRAVKEGETVTGRTWVEEPPRGARFDRHMEFTGNDGRVCVRQSVRLAVEVRAAGAGRAGPEARTRGHARPARHLQRARTAQLR